jgi:hypothetical protein
MHREEIINWIIVVACSSGVFWGAVGYGLGYLAASWDRSDQ